MFGYDPLMNDREIGTGLRRRAYRHHEVGEVDGEQYNYWAVIMVLEVPMPDKRTWGQAEIISARMWEDEEVRERVWKAMERLAREGIGKLEKPDGD